MKPEAQRIAIAIACGWKLIEEMDPFDNSAPWCWFGPDDLIARTSEIPDYLDDLDSMAEAEKLLTDEQLQTFADWLGYDEDEFPYKNVKRLLRATAAQRAEALLRTLGKWTDDK
jgi:hypothetical protein